MKKLLIIFILFFFIFGLISCDKKKSENNLSDITIGENGNWFINGVDTNVSAKGENGKPGEDGKSPEIIIGKNGNWYINGVDTTVKAQGPSTLPEIIIGSNGNWFIDGKDSGVNAKGEQGKPGNDGNTPYIGDNGNWFINDIDTGVHAKGDPGADGNTPFIGDNGHWWIGNKDTGVVADYTDNRKISDGLYFITKTAGGKAGYVVSQYDGTDENIVIPNYVGSVPVIGIESNAFANYKGTIKSVSLSKNTVWLGSSTFKNITTLTSIDFNGCKLKEIPEYAFYGTSITNIVLPDSVTKLGDYAFGKLTDYLYDLNIDNITYYGEFSLYYCYFDFVYLNKNVEYVGNAVFDNSYVYAEHESSPANWPFNYFKFNCKIKGDYLFSVKDNKVILYQYLGKDKKLLIPSEIDGLPVDEIGYGFNSNRILYYDEFCKKYIDTNKIPLEKFIKLEEVKIPNTVTRIQNTAFSNSPKTLIYVPSSVKLMSSHVGDSGEISNRIYSSSHVIFESDTFPTVKYSDIDNVNNTVTINDGSYNQYVRCTLGVKYEDIIYDSDNELYLVKEANGYSVLSYMGNRTDVNIPSTFNNEKVTSIKRNAFFMTSISGVLKIGNNIESIESKAFNQVTIGIVTIPKSVTHINSNAFYRDVQKYYIEHQLIPELWDKNWTDNANAVFKFDVGVDTLSRYDDMYYFVKNNKIVLVEYVGNGTNLVIPRKIDGMPVEQIQTEFLTTYDDFAVFIPNSVIFVATEAFINAKPKKLTVNLEFSTIPETWENKWYIAYMNNGAVGSLTTNYDFKKLAGNVYGTKDFLYAEYDDHISLLLYIGEKNYDPIYLPKTIHGKTVTTICTRFLERQGGTIFIPSNILIVEQKAFVNISDYNNSYFNVNFEVESLPSLYDENWYYNSYYNNTWNDINIKYNQTFESPDL